MHQKHFFWSQCWGKLGVSFHPHVIAVDFKEWFGKHLCCTFCEFCSKKKKKKIQELGCQIFPDLCRGKVASLPGLKGYSWEEAWAGKQEQDAPLEE